MKAVEKLNVKTKEGKHICVGLDSDISRIPGILLNEKNPVTSFNKKIIDVTKDLAAAYKINFAFYESLGRQGFNALVETVEYLPDDVLIIADAKRGDIGNTSAHYAKAVFDELGFDAVTLHPYMGWDSVAPFAEYGEKLSFILGLTSNPSAGDFEKQILNDGKYLFQKVILKTGEWNKKGNLGVVFGATKLDELKNNFELLRDLPLLLPGVGAQGGSLREIKEFFSSVGKEDYIVNISRSLIFAGGGKDFEKAVELKMKEYHAS